MKAHSPHRDALPDLTSMDAPKNTGASANGGPASDGDAVAMEAELSVHVPAEDPLAWEPLLVRPSFSGPSGDGAGAVGDAAASKIREILFGQHMAEYERRFAQLEVRLARELEEVRQEAANRSESLQSRVSQDVANLGRQIENERKERVKEVAQLGDHHRAVRQEFEVAIDKTARDAEAAVVHLRHALQEETARQRRALEERTDAIERQLDSVASTLGKEKVDRSSLQVLFEQLSVHFGADAPRPGIGSRLDGKG